LSVWGYAELSNRLKIARYDVAKQITLNGFLSWVALMGK
jgi:hypothetical protein